MARVTELLLFLSELNMEENPRWRIQPVKSSNLQLEPHRQKPQSTHKRQTARIRILSIDIAAIKLAANHPQHKEPQWELQASQGLPITVEVAPSHSDSMQRRHRGRGDRPEIVPSTGMF